MRSPIDGSLARWSPLVIAASLLASSACSPGDGGPPAACCETPDSYPNEVCVDRECFQACGDDADCEWGNRCVRAERPYCDPRCEQALCPERFECEAERGSCWEPDLCGNVVPCLDDTMICDSAADKCYPRNGDCSTEGCPHFEAALDGVGEVGCDDATKLCAVARVTPDDAWLSSSELRGLAVRQPSEATTQAYPDASEIRFEWEDPGSAVLLRVLTPRPASLGEYEDHVVWGASVPSGGPTTLRWSEGYAHTSDGWREDAPAPPVDGTYYLSIVGVTDGARVSISELMPFRVGSEQWPQPADLCQQEGAYVDCDSPVLALSCHDAHCWRICASHLDCPDEEGRCGDPIEGRRMCGVGL
jgi:hypothetical protein